MSGAFSVEERSSRNRLVIVRTATETLTIKQHGTSGGIIREAEALKALAGRNLAFQAPEMLDRGDSHLILSSRPGLVPIHERWQTRRPSEHQARRLGRAIASLQMVDPPTGAVWSELPFNPSNAGPEVLAASAATRQVVRRLQDENLDSELARLTSRLLDERRVFCHGDLRTQNILMAPSGRGIDLIDWETACAGPPSLDIGAGLAMFVELALVDGRGVPDAQAMLSFLAAWDESFRDLALDLVLRCAGLRLLQTSVEHSTASHELPEVADRLCRIGVLFIRRPREGAVHLRLLP